MTSDKTQAQSQPATSPLAAASAADPTAPLIAAFAHEINSSLSGAKYALSSVLDEDSDQICDAAQDVEHLRDALLAVRSSLEAGAGVVGQALEYARLGRLALSDESVDAASVIKRLHTDLKSNLTSHDITVASNVSPEHVHIAMKEAHLYAILRNLMSNSCDAITSRPEPIAGKIAITLACSGSRIDIKVEDNGIGIPESMRGKIFKPFFTTKRHKGTGIGLGFCRQIAALYGGDIDWTSGPDGTTFNVVLHAESNNG